MYQIGSRTYVPARDIRFAQEDVEYLCQALRRIVKLDKEDGLNAAQQIALEYLEKLPLC
jgi:glutamate dehydrogenase/leucine dehydrogenase